MKNLHNKVNSFFEFNKTIYKKGNKRRTRFECLNMSNHKIYLFNQNVEIKLATNNKNEIS